MVQNAIFPLKMQSYMPGMEQKHRPAMGGTVFNSSFSS
jgi:hypothetical protein